MDDIEALGQVSEPKQKSNRGRRRLVTAGLVAGALLGSAGIAAAQTGSTTTNPPSASATGSDGSQATKATSNEDPTHEAGETPEQEAAEDAGLGHRGGHGPNEDPAHEAAETPEHEAAEHAGRGAAGPSGSTTPPTASNSASASGA